MKNNSDFIEKLRSSGLRPTKQRVQISKVLFNRENTFHFTIKDLFTTFGKKLNKKISLATIYNNSEKFVYYNIATNKVLKTYNYE